MWNTSWIVDTTRRAVEALGLADMCNRFTQAQLDRLNDFFAHYDILLDPAVTESQDALDMEIAEAKLEKKPARFRNGRAEGAERMIIKYKPVRRAFDRWGIIGEVLAKLAEEYCGGGRCGQQAAMNSERGLYDTGDMPDLSAFDPDRTRCNLTENGARNTPGLTGGRASFRSRR